MKLYQPTDDERAAIAEMNARQIAKGGDAPNVRNDRKQRKRFLDAENRESKTTDSSKE